MCEAGWRERYRYRGREERVRLLKLGWKAADKLRVGCKKGKSLCGRVEGKGWKGGTRQGGQGSM